MAPLALDHPDGPAAPPAQAAPTAWVLHDGKPGMRSQALGLAEALGFPFREIALTVRAPWRWLPPLLWPAPLVGATSAQGGLTPPWPGLVISCGRNAVRPALAVRAGGGGRTLAVHIQDPRLGRRRFDLLAVPEHDQLRGPNVVLSRAALHRVTPQLLDAESRLFPQFDALLRPVLGVLIGGSNRAYRLDLPRLARIADDVAAILRRDGGAALVTASRRTGAAGVALLRQRLAGLPATVWDGIGANPYYAYLAAADAFMVTADSVSMISEAAATGKPVHVIGLDGGDAKFERFHQAMRAAGIARPFNGKIERWSYVPPDDTRHAAARVRELVASRLASAPRL